MIATFNVVSEVGQFPQILFSSSEFDECVRFIIEAGMDRDDDVFIQDAEGNIFAV